MACAAVGVDGHEAADVLGHLASEVTFDGVVFLENLQNGRDVGLCEIARLRRWIDAGHTADFIRDMGADAIDVAQGDVDVLVVGDVNT